MNANGPISITKYPTVDHFIYGIGQKKCNISSTDLGDHACLLLVRTSLACGTYAVPIESHAKPDLNPTQIDLKPTQTRRFEPRTVVKLVRKVDVVRRKYRYLNANVHF